MDSAPRKPVTILFSTRRGYVQFTSYFDVCIFAAGRQVQEAAKYSEREERSLTGVTYMEDRAIKKAQDETGNSIFTVCELLV